MIQWIEQDRMKSLLSIYIFSDEPVVGNIYMIYELEYKNTIIIISDQ